MRKEAKETPLEQALREAAERVSIEETNLKKREANPALYDEKEMATD